MESTEEPRPVLTPAEPAPGMGWRWFRHDLGCLPQPVQGSGCENTNTEMQSPLYVSPQKKFAPLTYAFNLLSEENAAWRLRHLQIHGESVFCVPQPLQAFTPRPRCPCSIFTVHPVPPHSHRWGWRGWACGPPSGVLVGCLPSGRETTHRDQQRWPRQISSAKTWEEVLASVNLSLNFLT